MNENSEIFENIDGLLREPLLNAIQKTLYELYGVQWEEQLVEVLQTDRPEMFENINAASFEPDCLDIHSLLRVLLYLASDWAELYSIDKYELNYLEIFSDCREKIIGRGHIAGRILDSYRSSLTTLLPRLVSSDDTQRSINILIDRISLDSFQSTDLKPEKKSLKFVPTPGGFVLDPTLFNDIHDGAQFLGLDFGTCTSVVSTATFDDGQINVFVTPVAQPNDDGIEQITSTVNSCVALSKDRVLFGNPAYEIRRELIEGETVFTSFKMRLGVDLGPIYNRSRLTKSVTGTIAVNSAQSATTLFLAKLFDGVSQAIDNGSPNRPLYLTVTVPASFESNQRRDLLASLIDAGIDASRVSLIDEPNAAFLATIFDYIKHGSHVIKGLVNQSKRILVYDFGAGTCDVSLLRTRFDQVEDSGVAHLSVVNEALSRFMALGGDDIDRWIANNVLVPQLVERCGDDFTPTERADLIVPWLLSTAEQLKVSLSKYAGFLLDEGLPIDADSHSVSTHETSKITIRGKQYELGEPRATIQDFVAAMQAFNHRPNSNNADKPCLTAPIHDVLAKTILKKSDIDFVLFIGGSSKNAYARKIVSTYLDLRDEQILLPGDTQSQVSRGAALHALVKFNAKQEIIQPIVSEDVFLVTAGGGTKLLLSNGAPVPSKANEHVVRAPRGGSQDVHLPICVGNANRLIHVLTLRSPDSIGFKNGEHIRIAVSMTIDKAIQVIATIGEFTLGSDLVNPYSNSQVTRASLEYLKARRAFNHKSASGESDHSDIAHLANMAQRAERYEDAVDLFIQAQTIAEGTVDYSGQICFCYSKLGDSNKCTLWAERAYSNKRTAVNAYNLAVRFPYGNGNRRPLLMEALELNSNLECALVVLGSDLKRDADDSWYQLASKARSYLLPKVKDFDATPNDLIFARQLSQLLNDEALDKCIELCSEHHVRMKVPFSADKLVEV